MRHSSQSQALSWFRYHYIEGHLELRPPFQRKPVWTEKQRCALIESILLGIPVPEIYVQVTQSEEGTAFYGVVDGQQRLRTILQFVGVEDEEDQEDEEDHNLFVLERLPANSVFKDKTFSDLTTEQKKRFFEYEICVRLLYTENEDEVEDVFKRLNKFTLPLKPQELRNATYHGAFAKLSEYLADEEYWAVNRIVTPASIRRMGDIEMMSDLLIGLMHGPQGGSAKILNQYYETYEIYEDELPGEAKLRRLFSETLKSIQEIFPEISDVARWGNRADFYSLFVAMGSLLGEYKLPKSAKKVRQSLIDFATKVDRRLDNPTANTGSASKEYARAIEKGSNDKARRADRHETLVNLIRPLLGKRA
jgi:hypothetical protein